VVRVAGPAVQGPAYQGFLLGRLLCQVGWVATGGRSSQCRAEQQQQQQQQQRRRRRRVAKRSRSQDAKGCWLTKPVIMATSSSSSRASSSQTGCSQRSRLCSCCPGWHCRRPPAYQLVQQHLLLLLQLLAQGKVVQPR
jgi:hypothetical protein